jgi:uncharacterized protein
MTVGERVAAASNRFYLRVRHPEAFRAAAEPGTQHELSGLTGHRYCLLTTFRRDGTPVPTPVWFGIADGRLYVRTEAAVGKVKRIRPDPHVRVAPCTFRGRPLGPTVDGSGRVLPAAEEERAERAIAANYGLGRRLYEGAGGGLGIDLVYLEVVPT